MCHRSSLISSLVQRSTASSFMSSRSGIRATPVLHGRIQAGLLMEDHSLSGRFVLFHYICHFYFCCKFYYYFYYLYYVKLLRLAAMSCIKAATLSEWSLNGRPNNGNKKRFMSAKVRERSKHCFGRHLDFISPLFLLFQSLMCRSVSRSGPG